MPEARLLDVQAFLDTHPFSGFQWRVFALCFCVVLLDGFDTAAIGYIAPSLMAEWGVGRADLAPVLSAALFGLAFGALAAGLLADRFGRKRVLVGSVGVIGAACLASAFAGSLGALVAWRFATGLGLGAAMPNAVTLMSQYRPTARRATLTNAGPSGFPLGAACGGFLAAWMIPAWGWRSVLLLGGVAPLVLALLLVLLLPELVRYMVAKLHPAERIRAVLRRIGPEAAAAADFTLAEAAPTQGAGINLVLSRSYLLGSAMLWLAYFMGLVIFYALVNWMPVLFRDAGLDARNAALIAALFPLGGVGAIGFGWLMDRMNPNRVIAAGFALTAVAVWAIGQAVGNLGLLMAAVFLGGTLMNTAQSSLPALGGGLLPDPGAGDGRRLDARPRPLRRHRRVLPGGGAGAPASGFGAIFTVVAIPGLVAAAALLVKHAAQPAAGTCEPRHWGTEARGGTAMRPVANASGRLPQAWAEGAGVAAFRGASPAPPVARMSAVPTLRWPQPEIAHLHGTRYPAPDRRQGARRDRIRHRHQAFPGWCGRRRCDRPEDSLGQLLLPARAIGLRQDHDAAADGRP